MKKNYHLKSIQALMIALCSYSLSYGQVYDLGPDAQVMDISNTGVAVGNVSGMAHFMWTVEDSGTIIAEGAENGIAGNERISADGTVIAASVVNPENDKEEAAVFNTETDEWTYLGSLGQSSGVTSSSAWGMSSNGEHVAGMAWVSAAEIHAVLWADLGESEDLGAVLEGFNSQAGAISEDGSIVAGWQNSEYGQRLGVYWEDGEQHYILDEDENYLGEVSAISADGQTMVGYTSDTGEGYIWNAEAGTVKLAHEDPDYITIVSSISDDGKVAVGYAFNPMDSMILGEGFIWTEEGGKKELNEYVESLGYEDIGLVFSVVSAISPDGKYIGGIGADFDAMEAKGFMIKLPEDLSAPKVTDDNAVVLYPNPVQNTLNVAAKNQVEQVIITNILGQNVYTTTEITTGEVNVSSLEKGVYFLTVKANNETMTKRFIKK